MIQKTKQRIHGLHASISVGLSGMTKESLILEGDATFEGDAVAKSVLTCASTGRR